MGDHILVIDEGTTSTRAIAFNHDFKETALSQCELNLTYPKDGWVEQDGLEIWQATLDAAHATIQSAGGIDQFVAIGITNQRETTLLWDCETGVPVGPAIVWQDRRTAPVCDHLRVEGHGPQVESITGLLIDPYFSATKIAWLIKAHDLSTEALERGQYAFGTIETWLIWNLTGGRVHATDVTNAARTSLMDLERNTWSGPMCDLFGVPRSLLPEIRSSAGRFGDTDPELFGRSLPVLSAIGDQQAALVGQGCLRPGQGKITLGTGAFLVSNTGDARPRSQHALLATRAYDTGQGQSAFALEGAIFNAGTVVKWLRDELGLIGSAADSEAMARDVGSTQGVFFVPAFTGLGAPHWTPDARGEITGLSRSTRAAHIVRAGLEACAYQARDLLDAFAADGARVETLRVDGGMASNDWLMQFMADICDVQLERPSYMEMTALGAAALAAFELGWLTPEDWAERDSGLQRFEPEMSPSQRGSLLAGWRRAIQKSISPV
ncbi:MAG: glycerol kinase GlpK [Pseudomonadota bacterium]